MNRYLGGWICEFCFCQSAEPHLPEGWDLVFQSAVCPGCVARIAKEDGGYGVVKGGAYATIPDPRGIPALTVKKRLARDLRQNDYFTALSSRTQDWLKDHEVRTLADLLGFDWGGLAYIARTNFGHVSQLEVMKFLALEAASAFRDLEFENETLRTGY